METYCESQCELHSRWKQCVKRSSTATTQDINSLLLLAPRCRDKAVLPSPTINIFHLKHIPADSFPPMLYTSMSVRMVTNTVCQTNHPCVSPGRPFTFITPALSRDGVFHDRILFHLMSNVCALALSLLPVHIFLQTYYVLAKVFLQCHGY